MVAAARTKSGGSAPFRPGDRVKFRFGLSDVIGTITEIVGPIAKGRRTVYRVELPSGGDEPLVTMLTAEELERAE
jgi:hypothetical protein